MDQRLISVDELRAAGALDVPASWRKSLGAESPKREDMLPGFGEDNQITDDAESQVQSNQSVCAADSA